MKLRIINEFLITRWEFWNSYHFWI